MLCGRGTPYFVIFGDSVPTPLKAVSCCGTSLESKTSHRYIRQKWRKRLLITIGVDKVPLQSLSKQPREEKRRVFKIFLLSVVWRNYFVCLCLHSSEQEGWEELSKAHFPKLSGSQGAQAGRPERRLQGNIFPWCQCEWKKGREKPHLHYFWEGWKENQSVGFVFFTNTAKAVEGTVFIGKMSLEGAKKHMWD